MTEIKIEQKKMIWPWLLLGLIIVALLGYYFLYRDNCKNTAVVAEKEYITNTNESDLIALNENNSTVNSYVAFVESNKDEMSLDHDFSNEALLKLIEATEAMGDEVGYEVRVDLEQLREYANAITKDPFETTHADNIRKAADMLTNVLHNIQVAKFPSLTNEVAELKNASESIKPNVLTLNQKVEVRTFFAKAANLLQKMN